MKICMGVVGRRGRGTGRGGNQQINYMKQISKKKGDQVYFTNQDKKGAMIALPENTTCSAALGSRFRIACAALLFFVVIAAAKGVNPALSLRVRSSPG